VLHSLGREQETPDNLMQVPRTQTAPRAHSISQAHGSRLLEQAPSKHSLLKQSLSLVQQAFVVP
jgi:hypothetical protein